MTGKSLVYDGDCGFCRAGAASLRATRLVPAAACRSTRDLDPEELDWLRREGLNNEMIVLGPAGELRRGADGILWILRDGWGAPFAWLAGLPGVRWLTTHAYRLISYNRRAIAPPKLHEIRCDCDPDPHAGYEVAFIVLCTSWALGVIAHVRPLAAASWPEIEAFGSPVHTMAALAAGWMILAAAALRLGELGLRYATHLAAIAAQGALLLLPVGLIALLNGGDSHPLGLLLATFCSFGWMTLRYAASVAFLGLGLRWLVAWMALVAPVGAAALLLSA